jgi:hypothetical protein
VRHAAKSDYSFASIVEGVAMSTPFRMRSAPREVDETVAAVDHSEGAGE